MGRRHRACRGGEPEPGWSSPRRTRSGPGGGSVDRANRRAVRRRRRQQRSGPQTSPAGGRGLGADVGAVDTQTTSRLLSAVSPRHTNGAIKPDLTAPGSHRRGRAAGSVLGDRRCRYQRLSGTSMAAPHVAGAAAILAGQHRTGSRTAQGGAGRQRVADRGATVFEQGPGGRTWHARQPGCLRPTASLSEACQLPHADATAVRTATTTTPAGPGPSTSVSTSRSGGSPPSRMFVPTPPVTVPRAAPRSGRPPTQHERPERHYRRVLAAPHNAIQHPTRSGHEEPASHDITAYQPRRNGGPPNYLSGSPPDTPWSTGPTTPPHRRGRVPAGTTCSSGFFTPTGESRWSRSNRGWRCPEHRDDDRLRTASRPGAARRRSRVLQLTAGSADDQLGETGTIWTTQHASSSVIPDIAPAGSATLVADRMASRRCGWLRRSPYTQLVWSTGRRVPRERAAASTTGHWRSSRSGQRQLAPAAQSLCFDYELPVRAPSRFTAYTRQPGDGDWLTQ